eukprot:4612669-Karenia_brevis.AAC.1
MSVEHLPSYIEECTPESHHNARHTMAKSWDSEVRVRIRSPFGEFIAEGASDWPMFKLTRSLDP